MCSGIEAATVAWHELGFIPAWFSEIAPFPSKVLAHRYPEVRNAGSLVKLESRLQCAERDIDLLVGGTPCQSFSVAGLRKGLADERGNLALEFCRLADHLRPRWILWENVPGVLSSDGGRAFGSVIGALVECGYGVAWRVLDARYFGVPQRRRRVFLVGYLGSAAAAASVLFEPEGVRRNPPKVGQSGKDVASTLGGGSGGRGWCSDTDRMTFVPGAQSAVSVEENQRGEVRLVDTAPALSKGGGKPGQGYAAIALHGASEDGTGRGTPITPNGWRVRRLTPRECERLQGFPDDYTAITGAKDGPRYAALGNSMAVPVMRWIGTRIQKVDEIVKGTK